MSSMIDFYTPIVSLRARWGMVAAAATSWPLLTRYALTYHATYLLMSAPMGNPVGKLA